MNTPILHEPHQTPSQMASEMLALEALEAEARVKDLEQERDSYRELLTLTLESSHKLLAELDRVREANRRLHNELRTLRSPNRRAA